MEKAGIWMVGDLRRRVEYWAFRYGFEQLLNHPLIFDVQLSHWTVGADMIVWICLAQA